MFESFIISLVANIATSVGAELLSGLRVIPYIEKLKRHILRL